MAKLELFVLGAPRIDLDSQTVTGFHTRKDQALLVYLAVTGTPHSRESLAALFWSELPEENARRNLRNALSHLQKAIGPQWLITERGVALTPKQPWSVDVHTLRTTLKSVTANGEWGAGQRAPQQVDALQHALQLYRGEFLQGFHVHGAAHFEEWVLAQREELRLLTLRGLETMVEQYLAQGAYEQGLATVRRLLQVEPWSESAHRQLMILLAASGQRAQALRQYEICRQILADELGAAPMAETTALYRQIQKGKFGGAPPLSTHIPVAGQDKAVFGDPRSVVPYPGGATPVALNAVGTVAHPNNLYTPLSRFIGRQRELLYLAEQLTKHGCRLFTIFGPGGVGKSSLALAFAQQLHKEAQHSFPDGIFFVALSGAQSDRTTTRRPASAARQQDSALLITAIAEAIGCGFQDGRPLRTQLIDALQQRRLLLILDNFEELVDQATMLVRLLAQAPAVALLITSRIRLNLRGETTLLLNGLSLPSPTAGPSLSSSQSSQDPMAYAGEAVALFVDRAQKLNPHFTLTAETIAPIAQICRAVAGLPLAIEMIAAWTDLYSCAEIAKRLTGPEEALALLTSRYQDQPQRQQSLQKIFADSWRLLPASAQWALAQLSIFRGQFTSAAAQRIAQLTPTDLGHLRDCSMLQVDEAHRYSLHPLIRQFAAEKWQALTEQQPERREPLLQAYSAYYLHRVARLAQPPTGTAEMGEAEMATVQAIKQEHLEIVSSWQWAMQQPNWGQIQQSMAGLFRYLQLTNQSVEGQRLFGLATTTANTPVVHWLQTAHCYFLRRLAEYDEARRRLEALLAVISSVPVGEKSENETLATDGTTRLGLQTYSFALCELGWLHYDQGDYDVARHCFATACEQAEHIADPGRLMEARNGLGAVTFSQKQYALAHMHYEAALTYATQRADLHYVAIVLGNLIAHAQTTKAFGEAKRYLQRRLEIDQKTQNVRQMAISYQRLGQMALIADDFSEAEAQLRKSLALFAQLGNNPEVAHVLLDLSKSLLCQQQIEEAVTCCRQSLQVALRTRMTPRILAALTLLAEIRLAEGQNEAVLSLLQMVHHNAPMPVASWRSVQKLEKKLVTALGENAILPLRQAPPVQSLQEFVAQLLIQTPLRNNSNAPVYALPLL